MSSTLMAQDAVMKHALMDAADLLKRGAVAMAEKAKGLLNALRQLEQAELPEAHHERIWAA